MLPSVYRHFSKYYLRKKVINVIFTLEFNKNSSLNTKRKKSLNDNLNYCVTIILLQLTNHNS